MVALANIEKIMLLSRYLHEIYSLKKLIQYRNGNMYLLQFEKEILNHAVYILNKKLTSQVSPMIF